MKTDLQKNGWRKKAVLFLVSQCITLFGSTLVQMAVVWYVTLETGSGVWVSAVSVSSYLPQFLISFPGGVWADRYHRKRLIIGADTATAAATLLMICLLPLLKGNGETGEGLVLAGLLLMSVLRSAGAGIQTPAVSAVIPQLVPEAELLRFNGANAAMQAVVQFASPGRRRSFAHAGRFAFGSVGGRGHSAGRNRPLRLCAAAGDRKRGGRQK